MTTTLGLCACGCGQPTRIATRNDPRWGYVKGQPRRFLAGHQWRHPVSADLLAIAQARSGFCACGCGQAAPLAKTTRRELGNVAGQPQRFLKGHTSQFFAHPTGANHPMWRGGRKRDRGGPDAYIEVRIPAHPRATQRGYVKEHILVAENALGKSLPVTAQIHHWNEDRTDNRPENLVICEHFGYHKLLHQRLRAWQATGHARARSCLHCGGWMLPDDPELVISPSPQYVYSSGRAFHRQCVRDRKRRWRQAARGRRGALIHQPRPCAICERPFTPLHRGDRYCSPACRGRAKALIRQRMTARR